MALLLGYIRSLSRYCIPKSLLTATIALANRPPESSDDTRGGGGR